MKVTMILAVLMMSAACWAQDLKSLQDKVFIARVEIGNACTKREKDALKQYSKTLDAMLASLKQKGDLKTYLVVEAEQKRLAAGGIVSTNSSPVFSVPVQAYRKEVADAGIESNRKLAALLRQYISVLDNRIKQSMQANKIEDAKEVQAEKDKVAAELADLEKKLPKVTNTASNVVERVQGKKRRSIPGRGFVEVEEFNGHFYLFVDKKMTWHEAKKACEKMRGHLVTITTKEENNFLATLTGETRVWIGLYRDKSKSNTPVWIDGTELDFTSWFRTEPNNLGEVEDYMDYVIWDGKPAWGDRPNNYYLNGGYVCEWDR